MSHFDSSDSRIQIVDDLGKSVGSLWLEQQTINQQKQFYIAAPISNTPFPIYQWVLNNANRFPSWKQLRFVLMDEQVIKKTDGTYRYVKKTDPASFERKITELFLAPLEMKTKETLSQAILKPDLLSLSAFDEQLSHHGGLDLLILALGENGHYAQVMPGTPIDTGFHVSELLESYKKRHESSGTFHGATFQSFGMSLGPRQVLEAKHIVVIVRGEHKRELAQQLFSYTSFRPDFPLSIIYHPAVYKKTTIYLTPEVL